MGRFLPICTFFCILPLQLTQEKGGIDDALIGANKSAEEEDEGTDEAAVSGAYFTTCYASLLTYIYVVGERIRVSAVKFFYLKCLPAPVRLANSSEARVIVCVC